MHNAYTAEDSESIYHGDHPDFAGEPLAQYSTGSGRWQEYITRVYAHNDGTLWAVDASIGLTEMQEDEFNEPPYQVEAREELVPAHVETFYYRDGRKVGM